MKKCSLKQGMAGLAALVVVGVVALLFAGGVPANATVLFSDNFESYAAGTDLNGQSGWSDAWGGDATLQQVVSFGGSKALRMLPGTIGDYFSMSHSFATQTSGEVTISYDLWYPMSTAGNLGFYNNEGSIYVGHRDNVISDDNVGSPAETPTIKNQWVTVSLHAYLDSNILTESYNGQRFWARKLVATPPTTLEDFTLFGFQWNERLTGPVYIDNVQVTQAPESPTKGKSIGVNFWANGYGGTESGTKLAPGDVVGVAPQGNWNNFYLPSGTGAPSSASLDVLFDNLDTPTGVSVTLSAGGNPLIGQGRTDPPENLVGKLLNGMASAHYEGAVTVSLSSIPYSKYDLIVYTDTRIVFDGITYTATGGTYTSFAPGVNYFEFDDLTGSSLSFVVQSLGSKGHLYGFQIVDAESNMEGDAVPEPAGLGLIGITILGIVRRRRS